MPRGFQPGTRGAQLRATRGWVADAFTGYVGQYGPLSVKTAANRGMVFGVRGRGGDKGRPHLFPSGSLEGVRRRGVGATDWGDFWQGTLGDLFGAARDKYLAPPTQHQPPIIIQPAAPPPQPASSGIPKWAVPAGLGLAAVLVFAHGRK